MGFRDWLRKSSLLNGAPSNPGGWTNDMSVGLRADRSVEELVDYILLATEQSRQNETVIADLGAEFGLSKEDAELSIDRVRGGIARARTRSQANCPDRLKDPIAWVSFQRTLGKS